MIKYDELNEAFEALSIAFRQAATQLVSVFEPLTFNWFAIGWQAHLKGEGRIASFAEFTEGYDACAAFIEGE